VRAAPFVAAVALVLVIGGVCSAHVVKQVGQLSFEVGWQQEPTYVGETNGVSVTVRDADDKGITDLGPNDLSVVVSTGGQQSQPIAFDPGFDLEENLGTPGEYDAPILPTAPGDYTFHITGSVHGQAVDLSLTSSDTTFDPVRGTADIEFPTKLPATGDLVTRLDRIDSRLAALGGTAAPTQAAVDAATAQAADAKAAADRALLVGAGIGILGLLVGLFGLILASRASRTARQA